MPRINSPIPVREIAAGSDIYDRGYHKGDPGGLDAVDTDLVAANIKNGITLFGVEGSYSQTPAEDSLASAQSALTATSSATRYHKAQSVGAGSSVDIASVTDTFDASAIVVGAGWLAGYATPNDVIKAQLVMDGVQVAESAYMNAPTDLWILMATKALSGEKTCLIRLHNYDASSRSAQLLGNNNGSLITSGISVGGIKV